MDHAAQARFDALRRAHFPPARNYLSAHLTLFHHLPADQLPTIRHHVAAMATAAKVPECTVSGVRFLGNGVAFDIESQDLLDMRAQCAAQWADWLTPQDRQKFRPHITVQNKVPAETAKALFTILSQDFKPWLLSLTRLQLWHYDSGPWTHIGDYALGKS